VPFPTASFAAETAYSFLSLTGLLENRHASPGSGFATGTSVSTEPKRFVCVLESTRVVGRHYVGLTSNVANRLAAHNSGRSLHSTKYGPWQVTAVVEFATESLAAKFERYLKSGSGRAFARRHFAK